MSIYFYAGDVNEIKALCGVKVLILPDAVAGKIKDQLDSIAREKRSPQTLENKFKQCLENELHSRELEEEYNHFKCLVHSRAANFFHIRNIMLRYTYSSYTRKRITNHTLQPHSIFHDVLAYFTDYTYFHHAAFPFIEGHHLHLSEDGEQKTAEAILYPDRIEKAREFLAKERETLKDRESSYRSVGATVDRNFFLLLKLGKKDFSTLEYSHAIDGRYLKHHNLYFWLHRMFAILLRRPVIWLYIGKIILSRIKIVYPYILGRLFPRRVVKQNVGILPAIICNNISIDPVAFPYNKQSFKSSEKGYPSKLHGGLANLLWHILSRSAVIAGLIDLGVSIDDIFIYFKRLRQFNVKWRPDTEAAQFQLARLDTAIINRVTDQCRKAPQLSPRERIPHLETMAIDIFNKFREEKYFNFQDSSSSHNAAVNCAYMHI